MNFAVAVLASGSKGNATFINACGKKFLVDIGLCVSDLQERLFQIGEHIENLDAVFITHEHNDHIKGLEVFAKNFSVPIYTSENTWREIVKVFPNICRQNCNLFCGEKIFDNVKVVNFCTSHDAADPHGYSIFADAKKLTYVTDTGFVSETIKNNIDNSDVLIIESNHDIKMLTEGDYPPFLKKRILSTQGHLANSTVANVLVNLEKLPEIIFLAHLSQHNNTEELALETIKKEFAKAGKNSKILAARQNEIVASFEIGGKLCK